MSQQQGPGDAYARAGVDIDAGDALVERIKPAAASTHRAEVLEGLGGFGGLFALGRYKDPVLVAGTDGVGTKLLIAQAMGKHDTIGIDLVAMCVNDIVVCGAEPLFFLDYFATGKLAVEEAAQVVEGIAAGCREAGCALLGGETAEMPGMYAPGHYDLAGFAVGVVERDERTDPNRVQAGDLLIGLPSSGLHSNGYSLVRKLVAEAGLSWHQVHPTLGQPVGTLALTPTRLYVRGLLATRGRWLGAAHITGGGLTGNVPRMLPDGLGARFDRSTWSLPPFQAWLAEVGGLSDPELYRTFNAGLGMVLAARPGEAEALATELGGSLVGEVVVGDGVEIR